MESSRRVSRKPRCAKSRPDTKVDFQFINVKPDDEDQKKETRTIVRANAAHFHWRHNRPPRHKAKLKQSGHGTISRHDNKTPTSLLPMDGTQIGTDIDPFSSYKPNLPRVIINHCIAFNAQFILPALFPDGANCFNVRANLIQMSTSHAYVLHMFLTGALINSPGTLGGTPSNRVADDMFRSRAEIVRNLNKALKDPVEACKDLNILAIIALAKNATFQKAEVPPKTPKEGPLKSMQLLNSLSLTAIDPIHYNGLTKLIEMKGGLEEIETPGLASVISLGDLVAGTRSCAAPRFSMETLSCPTRDFVFHSQGMPGFGTDQDLYMVTSMLRDYTIMIDDFCEGRQIFAISTLIDHRNMTQHALLSLPQRAGTSECYRLAALIYSLLVTFPVHYTVAPFKELVMQLIVALAGWDGNDYMLLWVLTIGGIGAMGLDERAWFMTSLQVTATRVGIRTWIEARNIMTKGLWHEATNDGDGQDLWLDSGMVE